MKRWLALLFISIIATHISPAYAESEGEIPRFPNLELRSLDGSAAAEVASFRGRPVLITFWASWCRPCRVELPELEKLYAELVSKGFVLLTVNVDRNPQAARRFMTEVGLRLPVYRVDPMAMRKLGISSIPTSILIDADGRPAQIFTGYSEAVPQEVRRLVTEMHDKKMAAREGGQ